MRIVSKLLFAIGIVLAVPAGVVCIALALTLLALIALVALPPAFAFSLVVVVDPKVSEAIKSFNAKVAAERAAREDVLRQQRATLDQLQANAEALAARIARDRAAA